MGMTLTALLGVLIWTAYASQADVALQERGYNHSASIGFLEGVVLQQMTLVQSLQASLEAEKARAAAAEQNLENRLAAAKDEYDRKLCATNSEISALQARVNQSSRAVAFSARFRSDNWTHGIPAGLQAALRLDNVLYNAGGGYDPLTEIFTAPLAGTYVFFLNFMAHAKGHAAIVKNGDVLDLVWSEADATQGATEMTSHLDEDDKVWVRHHDTTSLRGGWYTVFTGFLLQAD